MVGIVEVSPRDGLQNERAVLETDAKVELITRAIAAGARRIESASFVHPKLVPAMADAEAVMDRVPRPEGVSHIGLVLNRRGYDRAVSAGVDEVNVVVPASDGFAKANQNSTTEALTATAEEVLAEAASTGLFATVTIATSFGCPFDGEVDPGRVVEVARRSAAAGAKEIAIADTIGVGVPTQVRTLLDGVREVAPDVITRAHFHNTRNTGFANAVAAYEWGVDWLDSSNGGIGGCPFAPAATGNIATEDLVYLLERMGVPTGLDLDALLPIAGFLSDQLGYRVPALLPRAGAFPG
ncbi:MAG TPA: hydroxymethylglutaryl-CoA lyase [Actinomycetospora sp.]|jgi:isopropylmalate/homocitrate/citramalate synthase|uniref:hydroxymethylglutaryl-CoA lyase n=1 Tax=Actinomycetospora sp. TaxID=1872135 RepID=UPI002F3F1AFF